MQTLGIQADQAEAEAGLVQTVEVVALNQANQEIQVLMDLEIPEQVLL